MLDGVRGNFEAFEAFEPAGRANKTAGRASEQAERDLCSEAAGRASEIAGMAFGIGSWDVLKGNSRCLLLWFSMRKMVQFSSF